MARLIDADALLEKLRKHRKPGYGYATATVGEMPTVDAVEVAHGYWVATPVRKLNSKGKVVNYCDYYHCSECGTDRPIVPPYNYCPNCGAKMDRERKDNG